MARRINQERKFFIVVGDDPATVLARWREQYPPGKKGEDKDRIGDKIEALGKGATGDQIAELIGNQSWTHVYCHSCGDYHAMAVEFGEYSDHSFYVCEGCLDAALQELRLRKDRQP